MNQCPFCNSSVLVFLNFDLNQMRKVFLCSGCGKKFFQGRKNETNN